MLYFNLKLWNAGKANLIFFIENIDGIIKNYYIERQIYEIIVTFNLLDQICVSLLLSYRV